MAGNGAAELLETMLSFPGSNPNLSDNEGNTPLHFAAQAGNDCLNLYSFIFAILLLFFSFFSF